MKRDEKKLDFIKTRAAGFSLQKTAAKLGVSLASCKKWEKALKTEVDEARATMEEDLARQFGLFRLAHLEGVGDTLQKIRLNVAARFQADAQEVPLAKMLEAQLKFEALAMDLEAENRKTTPAMILAHLEDVKKGKAAPIDEETLEKIKAALNEITPKRTEAKAPFVSLEDIRAEAVKMGVYG